MNSKKYNILLAGLMCIGLGACGTSPDRTSANTINSGELYGETAGGIGTITGPAMAGADTSGSSGTSSRSATSGSASGSGTSSGGSASASGTPSGGGAATSSGSSAGADMPSPGMTSYGVIHSIDAIPRAQAFGSAAAASASVGSQSGGSGAMTGSGSSDMVYRVTLQMDDGSTRAVIQESRPSFQTGDRVRMASNLIQRY